MCAASACNVHSSQIHRNIHGYSASRCFGHWPLAENDWKAEKNPLVFEIKGCRRFNTAKVIVIVFLIDLTVELDCSLYKTFQNPNIHVLEMF